MPHQIAELQPFQKLFNLSLDVICILDQQGHFLKVNKAATKIWGYEPEELIGRNIFDLIYEEDKERTIEITRQAIEEGKEVINFENRYIRSDSTLVDMEWTSIHEPEEHIAYAIGRDVSERKRRELLIAGQKEKLEKAQEIAKLGYWEYNLQDQSVYWSDSLYTIFGVDKATFGEPTLEKYYQLVYPEDQGKTIRDLSYLKYMTSWKTYYDLQNQTEVPFTLITFTILSKTKKATI